jgi:hypothetical protein
MLPFSRMTRTQGLVAVLGVLGAAAYLTIGRDAEKQAVQTAVADIEKQVAADALAQYEIAKRQGDPMQTCVQAGFVSAAYLQAKDEGSYRQWKSVEKADCAKAGLPQ